jgi:hypothetical protein
MKFIIHGPDFYEPRSAGVRVLNYLANLLALIGVEVTTIFPAKKLFLQVPDIPQSTAGVDDAIVVYPDVIRGNPLGAKRVVRYMLYFPPHYYGSDRIAASELPIIYDEWLFDSVAAHCDQPPERIQIIRLPSIEPGLFHVEQKTVEAVFYAGKGAADPPDGSVVVTRDTHSREAAAALLRRAKRFYTPDTSCAMSVEAQLCGCESYVLREGVWTAFADPNPQRWVMAPQRDKYAATVFAALCYLKFPE